MMFDPTRHGLNVMMPDCDASHPLVEHMIRLDPTLKVLKITTKGNEEPRRFGPKFLTCVSALEYITGVSYGSLGALTPYKFYKALKKGSHPNIISVRELLCQQEKAKRNAQRNAQKNQHLWIELPESVQKQDSLEKKNAVNDYSFGN
jgi:hypothetical protein